MSLFDYIRYSDILDIKNKRAEQMEEQYIDFQVTPYALPDVCEALYNNGITNAVITKEDGKIHIRWKYDINRDAPKSSSEVGENDITTIERNTPIASVLGDNNTQDLGTIDSITKRMLVKKDGGGYPYIERLDLYDYDKNEPIMQAGERVIVTITKET